MDKRFTPEVVSAAQTVHAKWSIFASICLAQWALESSYGTRKSGRNNYFGIKAAAGQAGTSGVLTQEQNEAGIAHYERARFADYPTVAAGFDGYGKFLSTPRYKPVRLARTPREAAEELHICGYATDTRYPDKLMAIINANGLTRFDSPSLTAPVAKPAPKPATAPKVSAAVVVATGAAVAAAAPSGHPWILAAGIAAALLGAAVFVIVHFQKKG